MQWPVFNIGNRLVLFTDFSSVYSASLIFTRFSFDYRFSMDNLSPVPRFNGLLDFVCVEPASVSLDFIFKQVPPVEDDADTL